MCPVHAQSRGRRQVPWDFDARPRRQGLIRLMPIVCPRWGKCDPLPLESHLLVLTIKGRSRVLLFCPPHGWANLILATESHLLVLATRGSQAQEKGTDTCTAQQQVEELAKKFNLDAQEPIDPEFPCVDIRGGSPLFGRLDWWFGT